MASAPAASFLQAANLFHIKAFQPSDNLTTMLSEDPKLLRFLLDRTVLLFRGILTGEIITLRDRRF